jgi:hypothetical protein
MVPEIAGNPRRLIRVKAGVRRCVHQYAMSENLTFTNEVICPVCGRPMILLRKIRRVFGDNLKRVQM